MAKEAQEGSPPEEEDPNILGDAEKELWDRLKDYTSRQVLTEEKNHYGQVIWTLHTKWGYSYAEMSENINKAKSQQALRRSVDRILGKVESPQKHGARQATKKVQTLVGEAAADRVMTNQELGEWLHNTYGVIAQGLGIDIRQLIAEAMDWYMNVRPDMEQDYELVVRSDISKNLVIQQLMETAAPNFLTAEKMRNITQMMELVAMLRAQGLEVPKEILPATMKILEDLDISNYGM